MWIFISVTVLHIYYNSRDAQRLRTSPYGGTDRFKFIGYNLSPQGTPLVDAANIEIKN